MNHFKYISSTALTVAMLSLASTSNADTVMELDEARASFVGDWDDSTTYDGWYGTEYRYAEGGGTADTATFQSPTTIDSTGAWCIYSRWTEANNRSTMARYQVFDGGILRGTFFANQQIDGGSWRRLGCVTLTRGQFSEVVLQDTGVAAGDKIVADGVRWVKENIDKFEINDEPGIEYNSSTAATSVSTLSTCNSYSNIRSVTVSPPRSPSTGYIVVRASGQAALTATDQSIGLGIDDSSGGSTLDSRQWRLENTADEVAMANYENRRAFFIQHVYTVSPGTGTSYPSSRTFYFKGCRESSSATGTIYPDHFTAEYFPTRY